MLHRIPRWVVLLLLVSAAPAGAREAAPDIQQFKPVTDVQGFVLLHDATLLPQLRPGVSLTLNYGVNPLEVHGPGLDRQFGIVDGIFGVDLTGAFGLFDWWEVGLHLPVAQIPVETSFVQAAGGREVGYGIGDVRLGTRLRILDPASFPLGVSGNLFLTLPTGNERAGLGRGLPGGGVRLAVSQSWMRVHFAVNLGWAFYPRATLTNLTTGDELTLGAGIGFTPLVDRLNLRFELDGSLTPGPREDGAERFGDPAHTPFEVLGSVEYTFPNGLAVRGGLGKGITPGFGATDFRVFAGVSYAVFRPRDGDRDGVTDPHDACPTEPEDLDGWEDADGCPDPDNDGDGFADAADQCPDLAEDFDGWEDADGCPDPDNDGDGLADGIDTCPDEPEDLDGFQDNDGCPDLDNDQDGIPDASDLCPNVAETVDGWQDEDGCPDPDNDGDGILDEDDLCPDDPEDRNGVRDEDGCPDDQRAVVREDRIGLLQPILFGSARTAIDRESGIVLRSVARLLQEHPEILRLRVEAHTDSKGSSDSNLRLSERRADAVVKALIRLGVDRVRLESAGYGDARPAASNRTGAGRAANRRVEFLILMQKDAGPSSIRPGAPAPPGQDP
jgi:outer membrane protein OmpA-like peptidoglycan-associated protein